MNNVKTELQALLQGEVSDAKDTLAKYSHDASLFEIKPQLVVYPKTTADVEKLVNYVNASKQENAELSLTARSGGTDMSGGAINDSIILAFEKYFTHVGEVQNDAITTQPGVYYHDFEPKALAKGLLMPSYPASREICMMGGIVANNSGGEKSLVYGKTQKYVTALKMVLSDGREHLLQPLTGKALQKALAEPGFEGNLYQQIHRLLTDNQTVIATSKPQVSKNSTGYNIWDAWDGKTLDLTKLIVGAQGTLGIMTEATFKLVPVKPLSGMVVVFMPSLKNLGEIINDLLATRPSSLESFDDHTLQFALRFFYTFHKSLGWKKFFLLGLSFIPVLRRLLRYLPHFPKVVLLAEFEGSTKAEIDQHIAAVEQAMRPYDVSLQRAEDKRHEEKFWIVRRESFNLLRKNVKNKHTAPFIDDLVVPPRYLPEFLPQLIEILERYQLLYTIAGHMGDGNFHIIPLMDLREKTEREKIPAVLNEVTNLVVQYHGSLSGEHNDGLIRGPFLVKMYPPEIIDIFKQIKNIFDPNNIFNPHKKITADWDFSSSHIRQSF